MDNKKLYLDEIEKIAYYKQRIIDRYIEKGTIIDKNTLQEKIDSIDTKLSIFRQEYISNGETLDIEKYNQQKQDLYQDLCILYKVVFDIAENKLATIENRINCNLKNINEIAKKYKYKTQFETLSIYGDTVYYSTNGFNQYYENGNVIINLGNVNIPSGSYVACICDCDEFSSSDIIFNFDDQYQISDYNYGKRYLKLIGDYDIVTNVMNKKEESLTAFNVPVDKINEKSKYNIFAGKDKIKISSETTIGADRFLDKTLNVAIEVDKDCDISFYVYGASKICFNHNNKYDYKSFDGYEINSPRFRQKILIHAKSGFTFDIATDGTIYADKQSCNVTNSNIVCPIGYKDIYDFMLEEIKFGKDINFDNVKVIVKNAQSAFYDINYIAIKTAQISELDGDIE